MAAARNVLQMRRVLSAIARNNQLTTSLLGKDPVHPSSSSIFTRADFNRRGFQTGPNSVSQANKDLENNETGSLKPESSSSIAPSKTNNDDDSAGKHSVKSGLKVSPRHDLVMIFTCKVCEERSVKTICRESYDKGVVVARCSGCNNLHLIADRLGWFGEPGSIEDFIAARGEEVKKGSLDTLNLTLEDLAGKKILELEKNN